MSTVLVRAFATDVGYDANKRTLTGRFVPYGETARVADPLPDGSGLDVYDEGFRFGAFARQAQTVEPGNLARIGLVHSHDGGLGFLGPVKRLAEEEDGLYGDVSVLRSKVDDVEDLLADGVDGLSIEFLERRGGTDVDRTGVRWRTSAHLIRIALEAKGAYAGARVMALRSLPEDLVLEDESDRIEAEAARKRADDLDAWIAEAQAEQERLRSRYGVRA